MEPKIRARELRNRKDRHYNCCQATFLPFAEEKGMDHETAFRLAEHFGGGMRRKAACGAVTGGLMALGLLGKEGEDIALAFQERFCQKAGALNCGELVAAAVARGEEKKTSCDRLVELAAELVEEFEKEGKPSCEKE